MKIAIVLNTSWNIYNFRRGLIKGLQNEGHQILAIAPRDSFSDKLVELGCQFIPVRMDSRGVNPFKDFALFIELLWIYLKYSPDIIFHYTIKPNVFGSIAAGILRIPNIANVCGLGTLFLNPGFFSRLGVMLYKLAFIFPRKVLFQNPDDRDLFVQGHLVNEKKSQLVPGSGVDVDHFRPEPYAMAKDIHFLLIARIILDKGIKEYMKAAYSLKRRGYPIRFSLMGQLDAEHKRGISQSKFKEWLDWSGVEYIGFEEDVRPYLAKCNAVVLPSYREGTPRSLLEAAASGKPIICTNVPGCNQVVKDGFNGFLCREKDAEDLASAMERFYHLELAEQRQMGRNSRTLAVRKFSDEKIISTYSELIREQFIEHHELKPSTI